MSMSREEIINRLAARLERKRKSEINWGILTSAVSKLEPSQKEELLLAIVNAKDNQVGQFFRKIIFQEIRQDAVTEATDMVADNVISSAELQRLL